MAMTIQERQEAVVQEFSKIEAWEDRYKKIIDIGKELSEMPEADKVDKNKVKGCQSQVWLTAKLDGNKVVFEADSDAVIVRGLVSLLLRVYSNSTPDEIIETPPDFVEKLGFKNNLSPSRTNGLFSMIKQIKYYATAFKVLLQQTT